MRQESVAAKRLLGLILVLSTQLIFTSSAQACSCKALTEEEARERSLSHVRIVRAPGWIEQKIRDFDSSILDGGAWNEFEAELVEQIQGEPSGKTLTVYHRSGGSTACAFERIEVGSEWVIRHQPGRAKLYMTTCNSWPAEDWFDDPDSTDDLKR